MEPYAPHLAIATSLAVGLLIGMEREQSHPEARGALGAGVRTYPILALIGALSTMLETASMWLPLVTLAGVFALVSISYWHDVRSGHQHGVTTEASVIATFLLGALAASRGVVEPLADRLVLVVALGVAVTFLLSSKQWLHSIASRVSREDFYATVKFLIVAAIVVPLLPDHGVGPLDAINPLTVGLMVVTIAGLSFVGYVAMRLLGADRGLLVGAAAGGLVSSTAVAISFSRRAAQDASLVPPAAGAIGIASAIMVVRMAVLVAVMNAPLLLDLGIPLAAATAGSLVAIAIVYRRGHSAGKVDVKNPFELGTAIRFGIVFALILLATHAADHYFGDRGLYLAAGVAGITDVDALTLSTARLAIDPHVATIAILIAAGVNTIVKSMIALVLGGRRLGARAFLIGGLMIGAATAAALAAL